MKDQGIPAADAIRVAVQEKGGRPVDLAEELGISEAQIVAAHVGLGTVRIEANPDRLIPMIAGLGEVMALTRNRSCVIEKVGEYGNYHPGKHAAMTLTPEIDLRIFPSRWVSAFAVETDGRRSIQVFDAAGDAMHKIHLRDGSDLGHWQKIIDTLRLDDQGDALTVELRKPVEQARSNPDRLEELRTEWGKLTDTHQFLRLVSRLKMNRLGAYRIAGDPLARRLSVGSVDQMLEAVRDQSLEVMLFVGNAGCIEIHGGPIRTLKKVGPWQNVLDDGFNIHLRSDHIAEVWAVNKPTQRGPAISVEVFDAENALIFQIFARHSDERDFRPEWDTLVASLPSDEGQGS